MNNYSSENDDGQQMEERRERDSTILSDITSELNILDNIKFILNTCFDSVSLPPSIFDFTALGKE